MIGNNEFIFTSIPKILFGWGNIKKLPETILKYGSSILLITGGKSLKESGFFSIIKDNLKTASIDFVYHKILGEPTPFMIDTIVSEIKNKDINCIVAIGGGSVIDAGKAISAMLCQKGKIIDYLEGIGTKKPSGKKVPFIAIPTTAGTGSEATKNAVICNVGKEGFKKSLRHDNYIPDIALIDPQLQSTCPQNITASCGMDSFAQLLESYVSTKNNPITDALAEKGIKLIGKYFIRAWDNGVIDKEARTGMSLSSLLSGITLANAGLGLVHGIASLIGGMYHIPHGVICATLTAPAIEINIKSLSGLGSEGKYYLTKYAKAGSLISGKEIKNIDSACNILIETINEWIDHTNIPLLSDYNISSSDLEEISNKADNKNNPVKLENKDIYELLQRRIR